MAINFTLYPDLSAELRVMILANIVRIDKIRIPPKQLSIKKTHLVPGRRVISHLMEAFSSRSSAIEYYEAIQKYILQDKQIVRVHVVNYDCANFKALLSELELADSAHQLMARYHFTHDWSQPLVAHDEKFAGPYFHFRLSFTQAFHTRDADKLEDLVSRLQVRKIRDPHLPAKQRTIKKADHLRIFFKAVEFDVNGSADWVQYQQDLAFGEKHVGPMHFLMAELQRVVAPPRDPNHVTKLGPPLPNINKGIAEDVEEKEYWAQIEAEEAARREREELRRQEVERQAARDAFRGQLQARAQTYQPWSAPGHGPRGHDGFGAAGGFGAAHGFGGGFGTWGSIGADGAGSGFGAYGDSGAHGNHDADEDWGSDAHGAYEEDGDGGA